MAKTSACAIWQLSVLGKRSYRTAGWHQEDHTYDHPRVVSRYRVLVSYGASTNMWQKDQAMYVTVWLARETMSERCKVFSQ